MAGGSAVVLSLPPSSSSAGRAFVCVLSLGSRCGSRCESGRQPVTAPHVTPGAINSWAADGGHPPRAGAAAEGARAGPGPAGRRMEAAARLRARVSRAAGGGDPASRMLPNPNPTGMGPARDGGSLAGWVGSPAEVRELCALPTPHHRPVLEVSSPSMEHLSVSTAKSPEL